LIPDLGPPASESDFYFVQADDPETTVGRIIELVKTRVSDVCSLQDSGLRDRALYPLVGRRRAPPDFFLGNRPWPPSYGVDVAAGRSHQQGDGPR
jgi:hypothetical protein